MNAARVPTPQIIDSCDMASQGPKPPRKPDATPMPDTPRIVRPWRLLAVLLLLATAAPGQSHRRPFAPPGTTKKTERIRTFDVQHVRGELTLDTGKSEIRGTVTHTITPLHPKMTTIELDCGSALKVSGVALSPA